MSYNPVLKAGQAISANSNPVVIASDQSPIPVAGTITLSTVGLASEARQDSEIAQLAAILSKIIAAPATESTVSAIESTLSSIDFATQITLAAILAKIIAAPATEAKQDTEISHLLSIDTKLTSPISVTGTVVIDETNLATSAKQDTGNTSLATIAGMDFATQTSLAALISANHTDLAAILTKLNASIAVTGTFWQATQPVSGSITANAGTNLNTSLLLTQSDFDTKIGSPFQAGGSIGNTAFIANAGTNLNTSLLALESGGNLASIKTNTDNLAAPTTIYNGKTTVTTAGTRVTLASSQVVKSVTIKALSTNTGFIYVGNATVASTNGFQLSAGDTVSMDIANLTTVNIDSSVNGEGVTYIGIN